MCKKIYRIDYKDLPKNFWDKVIYYDYFISFSGFVEIEPHVTIWTSDGMQYYINMHELRDGRYDRVIPFFACMAHKDKVEKGIFFYFDWDLRPDGWDYFHHQSNHCFVPSSVYKEFSKNNDMNQNGYEYIGVPLRKAYKEVLNVTIQEDVITYIRFDEKIHVYDEPYVGRKLDIFQPLPELLDEIKNAVAWSINYTTPWESTRDLIKIWIYFDKEIPIYISNNFEKGWGDDSVDEKDFMECLMKLIGCKFERTPNGYLIDKALDGYTFYQRGKYKNIYWIRNDVYMKTYNNVIQEFNDYTGSERFLQEPICRCIENREGYIVGNFID